MQSFTAVELTAMQSTQMGAMMDTCIVQSYFAALDDYGAEVAVYTDSSAIACGVNMNPGKESRTETMNVERIDVTIRLPIATSIKATDRIKVTHRFGVAITNIVFEVVGSIRRGPSGLQVDVSQVLP